MHVCFTFHNKKNDSWLPEFNSEFEIEIGVVSHLEHFKSGEFAVNVCTQQKFDTVETVKCYQIQNKSKNKKLSKIANNVNKYSGEQDGNAALLSF